MRKPRLTLLLLLVAITAGGWQFGQGVYLYFKAELAQSLLKMAWYDSIRTQQNIKPWPWADTWPVARMQVPALGVELIVLAGDSGRTLAFGPGHQFGTVQPGQVGNSIISAHRDTHFQFLQRLSVGDDVLVEDKRGAEKHFVVTDFHIVDSRIAYIPLDYDEPALTLVTCYPFNSIVTGGPLRYVVYARQIGDVPLNDSDGLMPLPDAILSGTFVETHI